jgi:hypothetical protein
VLIDQLMIRHKDRVEARFVSALSAMAAMLRTRRIVFCHGKPVDLGPDHRVCMKAVGWFTKTLKLIGEIQTSGSVYACVRFLRVLISIAELSVQVGARYQQREG